MSKTVVLLRGINVGGRNKLPMKSLVALLEGLGFEKVKTYIQSGNVVVDGVPVTAVSSQVADKIANAISDNHGFTPRVLLISAADFKAAAANNPFPDGEDEPKTLHLYFLEREPSAPDLNALEAVKREREAFLLRGKVFYLHAPDGIGRSKLAERVEKKLGVPATARNWRTVNKLLAMMEVG